MTTVERDVVSVDGIDLAFTQTVRGVLEGLALGRELSVDPDGGLGHLIVTSGSSPRASVVVLAQRWFGLPSTTSASAKPDAESTPILNNERFSEAEKIGALIALHVGNRRPWSALSTNESTFYRYRRMAFVAFIERAWSEIIHRPLSTNRPRPEYDRFVGRAAERAEILRLIASGPGSVVGIEGPGGSGKTALAQAVISQVIAAATDWRPVRIGEVALPIFDAVAWVANRHWGLTLGDYLDVLARTLDYPGLLGRELADRRSALREILGRQAVLIVVDDADQADPEILAFLMELPGPSRALITSRRKLPPRVAAVAPGPLDVDEALSLLRSEGARQSVPRLAEAPDAALRPLAGATRRFPLLAVWAAGQLRQGQTVERVQARLARAEGSIFEEMFAGLVQALSTDGRLVLRVLPLFPVPASRSVLAAAVSRGDPEAGIDDLLEASLLEATDGLTDDERRYSLHPVARAFVRRRLPLDEAETCQVVFGAVQGYRRVAEAFAGSVRRWPSFDRIEGEIDNILELSAALVRATGDHAGCPDPRVLDQTLVDLARDLRNFFWLRHFWRDGLAFFHRAVDAARRLGDRRALGWNTYSLAYLHYELGTAGYREARVRAAEAVEILRQAGELRGVGHAKRLLGRAARERGEFDTAWALLAEAADLLAIHGRGDDLAIVRASQADLLRRQGRLDEAADRYLAVIDQGLEDPGTRATVLQNLADVRLRQGDLDVAETLFVEGEAVAAEAGVRGLVAECRWGLAQVALQRNDPRRCAALARQAADLFERLGESERAAEAIARAKALPDAEQPT